MEVYSGYYGFVYKGLISLNLRYPIYAYYPSEIPKTWRHLYTYVLKYLKLFGGINYVDIH